jgi:hypothetical protein
MVRFKSDATPRSAHAKRAISPGRILPKAPLNTGTPSKPRREAIAIPYPSNTKIEDALDLWCHKLRCGQWTHTGTTVQDKNSSLAYRELCTWYFLWLLIKLRKKIHYNAMEANAYRIQTLSFFQLALWLWTIDVLVPRKGHYNCKTIMNIGPSILTLLITQSVW